MRWQRPHVATELAEAVLIRVNRLNVLSSGHQQLRSLLKVSQPLQLLKLFDYGVFAVKGAYLVEGELCGSR